MTSSFNSWPSRRLCEDTTGDVVWALIADYSVFCFVERNSSSTALLDYVSHLIVSERHVDPVVARWALWRVEIGNRGNNVAFSSARIVQSSVYCPVRLPESYVSQLHVSN